MKEQKLKSIIAEAMYAGTLLAERNYGGVIMSKEYEPYVSSLNKLDNLLKEFVSENGFSEIQVDKVLPLQKEINIVTKLN